MIFFLNEVFILIGCGSMYIVVLDIYWNSCFCPSCIIFEINEKTQYVYKKNIFLFPNGRLVKTKKNPFIIENLSILFSIKEHNVKWALNQR